MLCSHSVLREPFRARTMTHRDDHNDIRPLRSRDPIDRSQEGSIELPEYVFVCFFLFSHGQEIEANGSELRLEGNKEN